MVAAYALASLVAAIGHYVPPIVAALIAGAAVVAMDARAPLDHAITWGLAVPIVHTPEFTVRALVEPAIPLTITVIGIHNAQGLAYLRTAGYRPPENPITVACGVGSIVVGVLGSVPGCLVGPVTGIMNLSGPLAHRWVSAVVFAVSCMLFGLFAPGIASLGLALPPAFIAALGGLAMLGVLQNAFVHGFKGRFTLGATVTFIVTASQMTILNVSAAFWALGARRDRLRDAGARRPSCAVGGKLRRSPRAPGRSRGRGSDRVHRPQRERDPTGALGTRGVDPARAASSASAPAGRRNRSPL